VTQFATARGLLEAIDELVRMVSAVALRHFRTHLVVETKSDGSPVTVADRAAELAAREWIEKRFPDDAILGEELGELRPDARRRWVIDPIDGTKSFVRGVPLWGTLVGVFEGDVQIAGGIACPAAGKGEIVVAARGEGCWWDGARCAVSRVELLDQAVVLTTDDQFPIATVNRAARGRGWHALADRAKAARTWGDCYGYLLVATGRAEVMVDPAMHEWDLAALGPVVEEAGGVFTDWEESSGCVVGSAVATNAALAGVVRGILRGADA
jgi:histidinol-phosphatase